MADDISSTGLGLVGTAAQWGGVAMVAGGMSGMVTGGDAGMDAVIGGAGAAIATVGIAIGIGNSKK